MNVEKFCEFDFIKNNFLPFTPYGKSYKENFKLINSKTKLIEKYDLTDVVLDLKKNKPFKYDKVKYHLKNIPYINSSKEPSDITDVFIYKKFINNYVFIKETLGKKISEKFGFKQDYKEIFDFLNCDGVSDTFYISEKYNPQLAEVRKKISDISKKIDEKKNEFLNLIKEKTGLEIKNEFLVVDNENLKNEFQNYFFIDVYDSKRVLLKPKYPNDVIELISKREEYISEEKKIESEVVAKIIEKLKNYLSFIPDSITSIEKLDIAVASAELASKFMLTRPDINSKNIYIKKGVFIPLKEELAKNKIEYTPLDFEFTKNINIIKGSNMGGKTVVLKTVVLLQLMAQYGLFVCAEKFSTRLFDDIYVLFGDEELKGLSSFASEIYDFVEFYKNISKNVLVISDEFARTTNSFEASSLINAIISDFSERKNIYFFLATHLENISKFKNTDFLCMMGFDKKKYEKLIENEDKNLNLWERIRFINKCMIYKLIRTTDDKKTSDALEIARILGIDEKIYKKAKDLMEVKYENSKN